MASFVVSSQLPRRSSDAYCSRMTCSNRNQDGTPQPFIDARYSPLTYTPYTNSFEVNNGGGYGIKKYDSGPSEVGLYSRKVFVGGLPPDISEDELIRSFQKFGPLSVNWPQKGEKKSLFPPKGYSFLIFEEEESVQKLVQACCLMESMLYLFVSSNSHKNKLVQVRPWNLVDMECVLDNSTPFDLRKTVFVGGVPRPLKAKELAVLMDNQFGNVCSVTIDTDPELHYPKGAARVTFSSQESYVAAINLRFVTLTLGDIDKRVELKPYVLGYQNCDVCRDQSSGRRTGPLFCASITCLKYYCEYCWALIHAAAGREFHKPVVKESTDRPRKLPYRWC